jgi:transposase
MRGSDERSGALFTYVDLEARVPPGHPLRTIRAVVNAALVGLSPGFHELYARIGRPSIPPEQLLRALLLQAFYSIRSERQLMDRLDFDLLFRWFVGLGIDDPVWNHSTFSKNRDRLLAGDVAAEFLAQVLDQPQVRRLLSSEHFSVDGSLVEAWASMKSFRPKDGSDDPSSGGRNQEEGSAAARQGRNHERDFHGERRTNDSHGSTTDPDARLYCKGPGQEAKLCFVGHVLMENRHGLVVDAELTRASGHAERLAALAMLDRLPTIGPITLAADRGFDARDSINGAARAPGDPAHRPEHQWPALGDRSPDDAPSRLRREPARSKAHRGSLRLDQDRRRSVRKTQPSFAARSAARKCV